MEVATAAGGKVAENLIDLIFNLIWTRIARVFKWKSNVKNLKEKIEKLAAERESVLHFMEAADRRGEEAVQKVKNWQIDADKYIKVMETLGDDEDKARKKCFLGVCPNPRARYQISKKVEEYLEAVTKLLEEASKFKIPDSYRPSHKESTTHVKGFEGFGSRMSVLDRIMEALRSASIDKIGVHGMPGVGKTMLAKEVARRAEEAHLFDAIVMASVSKNPDLRRIQGEIADRLDLQLHGETEFGRANQLKAYLKKKKRILVILDDIWRRLDLDELGIPFEEKKKEASSIGEDQTQCKILFTSRFPNVLSRDMRTHQDFEVGRLQDEEAWELLKKIVGSEIEKSELQSTAMDIAKKCAGLPLGIQTLGNSLKGERSYEWSAALLKLKRPSPESFVGISAEVYSAIELSYKHLDGEELKQTFLLCSLLGQNASIEDLLKFGIGLGLFHNVSTIGEARDRALTLVSNLKSSSLLLDGYSNIHFDMHDIVRDVAISIASRDHHLLSLIDDNIPERWLDREAMGDIKWITLQHANISELPDELECSQLTLFYLFSKDPSMKIPENFFRGMPNLRVLDFTQVHFSSLPSSICLLKKLRTLQVNRSIIKDIACIGELICLEVLSLSGSDIEELPTKIGQLNRLKFLDLSDCTKLRVIQPHVLASLSRLEELYMGNSFNKWEPNEHGNQRNASLAELKDLRSLTALDVHVCDVQLMPEDLFSERLKRYKIFIGEVWKQWDSSFKSPKILKLELNISISYDHSIGMLLKKTEELHLEVLKGVKNVVYELDVEGFQELRYFYVKNAPEVQHIINSMEWSRRGETSFSKLEVLYLRNLNNLVKICHGWLGATCFNRLRIITVECCNQLKNLFPFSIARQLLQLEKIRVTDCSDMLKIVAEEGQEATNDIAEANENLELAKLRSLKLQYLPKFLVLCHGNEGKTVSSSKCAPLFNEKVIPQLEKLSLTRDDIAMISNGQFPRDLFSNVKVLRLLDYEDGESPVFPIRFLQCFPKLEKLHVGYSNFKELFPNEGEADGQEKCVGTQLHIRELKLESLDNLRHICNQDSGGAGLILQNLKILKVERCHGLISLLASKTPFRNLTTLVVVRCQGLINLVSLSTAHQSLVQLETMSITACHSLTEIVGDERNGFEDKVVFMKLKVLRLRELTKLTSFCSRLNFTFKFPSLEHLVVSQCPNMETFCKGFVKTPMLQRISLEDHDDGRPVGDLNSTINQLYKEKVGYAGLSLLKLSEFPKLMEIWNKNPQDILDFRQIFSLEICNCDSLRYLLTPSMVLSLSSLMEITVQNCEMIEQIITEQAAIEVPENKIIFPQLHNLTLKACPNLTSFIVGSYKLECPSLLAIEMANCPKMVTFSSTFSIVQEKETTGGGSEEMLGKEILDTLAKPFFSDQVVFPSLGVLSISEMGSLIKIWDEQLDEDSFHKLCSLSVEYCEKLLNIFPVDMVGRLQNLVKLRIRNCVSLEEIFEPQGLSADESQAQITVQSALVETTPNFVFPEVASLYLWGLPNLKSFYSKIHTTEWPSLKKLDIRGCDKVQILASELPRTSGENQLEIQIERPLFWVSKASFPNLEELIVELNDDLKEIWHGDVNNGIIFTKLKSLQLNHLPRLASFCLGNCNFEFPSLKDVIVKGCPNMMTFSGGEVSAPNLQKVKFTKYEDGVEVEECWAGGLNATIQQFVHKKMRGDDSKED